MYRPHTGKLVFATRQFEASQHGEPHNDPDAGRPWTTRRTGLRDPLTAVRDIRQKRCRTTGLNRESPLAFNWLYALGRIVFGVVHKRADRVGRHFI